MVGEPGISDLFHGRESHFDDVFDLSSGDLDSEGFTPGTLLMT